MKTLPKIVSIFMLMLLASPVLLLKGCGESTALNGGPSGACPSRVAPDQSSIVPTTSTLATPSSSSASCYPHVVFTIYDADKQPMNNICVEIYTDGYSVMAKQPKNEVTPCSTAAAAGLGTLNTSTDDYGNVTLELLTPACTVAGQKFFIHASSGNISGEYTATCP